MFRVWIIKWLLNPTRVSGLKNQVSNLKNYLNINCAKLEKKGIKEAEDKSFEETLAEFAGLPEPPDSCIDIISASEVGWFCI